MRILAHLSVARMERERHPGRPFSGFRCRSTRATSSRHSPGRAMTETMIGLSICRRIDMKVDHADAALLEHVDTFGDRRIGFRLGSHWTNADRALRLGKLGDVRHRILHA